MAQVKEDINVAAKLKHIPHKAIRIELAGEVQIGNTERNCCKSRLRPAQQT
jgi:hypothetical protein